MTTTVAFSFKQAYGLTPTLGGFTCKIATNYNNVVDLSYYFTTQDIADMNAGRLLAMDIVRREVKKKCDAFCAQLTAQFNANAWTVDGSGNMTQIVTSQPQTTTFNTTTLTAQQLIKQGSYTPLYSWNAGGYSQVATDKQNHPAVPTVVAINPASGPGTAYDATIATAVKTMQSAGCIVLEYIGTNYGSGLTKAQYPVGNPWPSNTPNDLASVEGRCLNAVNWYGVDGFMFDDFSNTQFITLPDNTTKDVYNTFYLPLITYARNLPGITVIKGNMGTKPLYLPLVNLLDLVCVFENSRNPTLAELQNNTYNGQLANKAVIVVNSVTTLDTTAMALCGQYAKFYYSSDSGYTSPPVYYDQMISVLSSQ